jgi:TetR/AcrR family transcriptional regulator, transcriptional repressor for nem operon
MTWPGSTRTIQFNNDFPSKEALAAETASAGLNHSNSKLSDALEDGESSDRSGLPKFVESYLSPEHRDDRAGGCTIASLACDAARETRDIQASFAKGIEEELGIFASYFAKSGSEDQGSQLSARERAIWLMAELVGAVILARAIARANPSLSGEILQTSRRMLLKRLDAARLPSRPRKKRIWILFRSTGVQEVGSCGFLSAEDAKLLEPNAPELLYSWTPELLNYEPRKGSA